MATVQLLKNRINLTKNNPVFLILTLRKSTNVDAIDSFTNNLVEQKALKWELNKYKQKQIQEQKQQLLLPKKFNETARQFLHEISKLRDVELCLELKNLNQFQIDNLITNSLLEENKTNFYAIIDQIMKFEKLPSQLVTLHVLQQLAETGDLVTIVKFIDLCKQDDESFWNTHGEFSHYRARCLWVQENSDLALKLLKETYSKGVGSNEVLRSAVREVFRKIIEETVEHKSEAVLIALKNVAIDLSTHYNEQHVLAYIWKSCFLSTWFSDQKIASELFANNILLRSIVGNK